MAEAKRIKATPVVQPPDMIQVTLTIEEAQLIKAVFGIIAYPGLEVMSVCSALSKALGDDEKEFRQLFNSRYAHLERIPK